MTISPTEFVTAWQKSKNIDEVKKTLGSKATTTSLRMRASLYRRKGIPLQKFASSSGRAPLDIASLAKLAKATGPTAEVKRKTKANKVAKRKATKKAKRKTSR